MASSGTYAFAPSIADLVVNAFNRIQIRPTSLTIDHLKDATIETNLLFSELSNKQPNLWTTETQSVTIVDGTATYNLPARTILILTAYIETGSGANTVGRVLGPLSATEYASMPNKQNEAPPTAFWFNRQITPTITYYPTPDATGTYTGKLLAIRQIQDAGLANGETLDVPYRWLDAITAGLAYRMARIYAPPLEQVRKADAAEAWNVAFTNDTEAVPVYVTPALGGYYRM